MYTFYFKVWSAGFSDIDEYKLIAVKGLHTPINPALGGLFGQGRLKQLLRAGHKVVIEPMKPSDAPHPEFGKGVGDTSVPTMRYAKGYRAPNLGDKVSYLDFSNIHVGETSVSVPWERWPSLDSESVALTSAIRAACFSEESPFKPVHFTDDGCLLTRWERVKAWFSRNFIPA